MQLARKMLKPKGFHGFIIPKPFIYSSTWTKIRDVFEQEIFQIVDCGKVWKEVKLEQIIYISKNGENFKSYENLMLKNERFEFVERVEKDLIGKFGFFPNGVSKTEISIALKMLEQKKRLFEISKSNRGGMFQKEVLKTGDLEVLGGANIQKYEIKNVKGFISKDLELTENSYFRENSLLIQEIVAHVQNPIDHIKITGTISNDNFVILDTVFQITPNSEFSNRYILALLHSKILNWFVYRFIFAKAIRTMHLTNSVLKKIPIPEISIQKQKPMIQLVDEVIELKSKISKFKKHFDKLSAIDKIEISEEIEKSEKRISEIENELDKTVFKLYGLNSDEIKIIES
jgi:cell division protein FtsB